MTNESELLKRYSQTADALSSCIEKHQRQQSSVTLVAVSKFHTTENILTLAKAGQAHFGENYVQESLDKIEQLAPEFEKLPHSIEWHFIGHIQSKKCKQIAPNFDWVHTVESEKVAQKLDQHREGLTPLNILIQLNLQNEESKSGITPDQLPSLAAYISGLKNLKLRGLMIIPESTPDTEAQRGIFRQCKMLLDELNENGLELDQLSMGMTNDMESAILEGATQVRIGTAIFGPRPSKAT
ncbi:MAG: YggS family pyridoxal phosphate-dependent enzyme [Gammaproteobacteria bacterium]|nr:YggS family pyridoxal phosphate-dependent enzyme [Gammaproteobacteria bacterium]